MTRVLEGRTVIELGRGGATARAGLLLAQSGAKVIRVDVPDSLLTDVQDRMWNGGKESAPFDLIALDALLRSADALVHDFLPGEARAHGLDAATLKDRYPHLIHAAIGGWPIGHPLEEMPVSDALVLASAGLLDEQQGVNREGPIWLRFPLGSAHAGYLAAIGICARFYARRRTGKGGAVHTSLLQGALIPTALLWHRADEPSPALRFGFPKAAGATLFRCRDGLWIHTMGQPVQAPSIARALEAMDLEERSRFNEKYASLTMKYIEDRGAIEAIFATRNRDDWLEELWANDVPAQPVQEMGALYFDEQAQINGNIDTVNIPDLGEIKLPGPPMRMEDGLPAREVAGEPEALVSPLDGLKVLDIGNFLAGPLAPQLLGDLGAEVIKLEAIRGDPLRQADWAFNGCQRNKRGIALSLKDPKARPVLHDLLRWADIVHHNQRMPAAEKLGFGREAVKEVNPAAIYCHVNSYGSAGPRKDWPGYDQLFQAASGWEIVNAGAGNRPMWCRFGMMDHLAALASVLGSILALLRRGEAEEGEFVSASLLGASLASVESYVKPDGTLADFPELDADQMGVGPTQRLFECADGWIAVDAPRQEKMPDDLGQAELREERVSDAVNRLDALGYPCVAVALENGQAFLADPDNQAAGLVARFTDTCYGGYDQIGLAWQFDDLAVRCDRAPPRLGEHSKEILAELGYDERSCTEFLDQGIVKAA